MYKELAVAALALGGVAHAQTAPEAPATVATAATSADAAAGKVVYDPPFFAQFTPTTALDMVRRVPGFTIDQGADRRGFAGSAGNVLIDGARPSAKSQSLEDILSRIPAAQVAHIELIRAAANSEASGQSVVVNVVRNAAAKGASGTYDLDLQRTEDERIEVRGSGSYTGHIGAAEYTLGAGRYIEDRPLVGDRTIRDGNLSLIGSRQDYTPRTYREVTPNASFTTPLWGGTLNLNASAKRWNFQTSLESLGYLYPSPALADDFTLAINERERSRELGGDYEHKFGSWTLKAVGLNTIKWYSDDESTTIRDGNFVTTDVLTQLTRNKTQESIGRGSAAWTISEKNRIEFGGEAAFNSLQTNLRLSDNGVPIILPSANVTVEEKRAEGFATWTWKPLTRWTTETGVTVETSTITQSGDTNLSRTLVYWKPSFQVSRQVGTRDQARIKIFRDVSQLNFSDFASRATLADNSVAAGNPDLRPQALWRLEGVFDKRFGENGALSLTLAHEWVEDATDLVPIFDPMSGQFFDAPGNIGKGRNYNIGLKGTLPLGFLLKGAQVEFSTNYVHSEVTDPTTKMLRPVTSNADIYSTVNFRQDLTAHKLAWGFDFEKASERRFFRVAERETYEEGPFLTLFAESTYWKGAKVRLAVNNVLDPEFRRQRVFYRPNRAGARSGEEIRERHFGRFVGIEVSGNF